MNEAVPHPIPYQGSKRRLAAEILAHAPRRVERVIEPFAGSAAVTLAAARRGIAHRYLLGEELEPLALLWQRILKDPVPTAALYRRVWSAQSRDPRAHFLSVRDRFNRSGDPVLFLFLLARCVKNAVRFNGRGEFNQSADHRRRGMHPDKMAAQIAGASELLASRAEVAAGDYAELLEQAGPGDLVYLDPPYQGVSRGRDPRYAKPLDLERFVAELEKLSERRVPYMVSFDGYCGQRAYGQPLPRRLGLTRVLLDAGPSSQATLSGRSERTLESLYLSPSLRAAAR